MRNYFQRVSIFLFLLFAGNIFAENLASPDSLVIRKISVQGLRRTRLKTVTRELTITEGEKISSASLNYYLDENKKQLVNTSLFLEVNVSAQNLMHDSVDVLILLRERWYTFPLPTFAINDRNFNVWWVEHNHDIKRVMWGGRFFQENLSGRNDELKMFALFGYEQRLELGYSVPYFNSRQTLGFRFNSSLIQSRNISLSTIGNKNFFYQEANSSFIRSSFQVMGSIFHKEKLHDRQWIDFAYNIAHIDDSVAILNTDYFLKGKTREEYFTIKATVARDYRDIKAYPLRGSYTEFSITKTGLGNFNNVNMLSMQFVLNGFLPLGKGWFASSLNKFRFSTPDEQPYFNQRGLGYRSDYVSGYEYYVVDGQSFLLTKNTVKCRVVNFTFNKKPEGAARGGIPEVPFEIFLKGFCDAGFVSDQFYTKNNPLNNTWLLGYGAGVDIVTFYDSSIAIEYSFNRLHESGLYLHFNSMF